MPLKFASIIAMFWVFSPMSFAQTCHNTDGWEAMHLQTINLNVVGEQLSLQVRVADTAFERAAGYQWICEETTKNSAVLFIFPKMFLSAFHMRNVFVPLDIYYFDAEGKQVDHLLMRAEPPGGERKPQYYRAASAFQYALEIPSKDILTGEILTISDTWSKNLTLALESIE